MIKSRETFHFYPPIEVEDDWTLGLIDSEVSNSIFNITEETNKLELYKFLDKKTGGVSYVEARGEIQKELDFSGITASDYSSNFYRRI